MTQMPTNQACQHFFKNKKKRTIGNCMAYLQQYGEWLELSYPPAIMLSRIISEKKKKKRKMRYENLNSPPKKNFFFGVYIADLIFYAFLGILDNPGSVILMSRYSCSQSLSVWCSKNKKVRQQGCAHSLNSISQKIEILV